MKVGRTRSLEVIIDGAYVKTNEDVHWLLKKALSLPESYGMSFDALSDSLAGWEEYPLWIRWTNIDEGELYPEELEKWKSFFDDAKKKLPDLHVIYRNRNHIYSSIDHGTRRRNDRHRCVRTGLCGAA